MPDVIDSSGWLEYFTEGGNAGAFDEPLNSSDLVVPTITIFEVYKLVSRLRSVPAAQQCVALMLRHTVVELDVGLAVVAAAMSAQLRLPMADSIILATARRHGATLWTQDADFAGVDGVRYLPKPG